MVQIDLKPWGIFQVSLSFVFLRNVSNSKCCTIAPSKKKKRKKSRPLTHSFVHCSLSMHPFCSMHCSRFWRWSRKWYRLCLHRYFFLFPKGERRMGHNEAWLSRCSFFFFLFARSVQFSLKRRDKWWQETTLDLEEHSTWNQGLEEMEPGVRNWLVYYRDSGPGR